MQLINSLYDINFDNVKVGDNFYEEINNYDFVIYIVSRITFGCCFEVSQYKYSSDVQNGKNESRIRQYNSCNNVRLLKIGQEIFEIEDYEFTKLDCNSFGGDTQFANLLLETDIEGTSTFTMPNISDDNPKKTYRECVIKQFTDEASIMVIMHYLYDKHGNADYSLYLSKNYYVITKQGYISRILLQYNDDLCKYLDFSPMENKFLEGGNSLMNVGLKELINDNNETLNKIVKMFGIESMLDPIFEVDDLKVYCNHELNSYFTECCDLCYEINGNEVSKLPDKYAVYEKVVRALLNFRYDPSFSRQYVNPMDKNDILDHYQLTYSDNDCLKTFRDGYSYDKEYQYYENVKGYWILNENQNFKNKVNEAEAVYKRLLEAE